MRTRLEVLRGRLPTRFPFTTLKVVLSRHRGRPRSKLRFLDRKPVPLPVNLTSTGPNPRTEEEEEEEEEEFFNHCL
jgi:hypothetical protein